MIYFLFTVCLGLTKKENAFTTYQIAGVFSEMLDAHAYSRKISVSRSPHTSLSPDESAAVQIHLEFNSTRKHFCHIFIRKLRFSRYTAEKGKCIPAYLLIDQTRRGVQGGGRKGERGAGEGRKGSGRREKGGGRREKGEKEEGEGRTGGREKG